MVPNGVDVERFASASAVRAAQLRASVSSDGRPLLLAVGGVEPCKGTDSLVRAGASACRSATSARWPVHSTRR